MAKLRDAAASDKPDAELFRLLVRGLLHGSWHDTVADTVRRRGLREKGAKGGRPEEILEKLVADAKLGELIGLAVELISRPGRVLVRCRWLRADVQRSVQGLRRGPEEGDGRGEEGRNREMNDGGRRGLE